MTNSDNSRMMRELTRCQSAVDERLSGYFASLFSSGEAKNEALFRPGAIPATSAPDYAPDGVSYLGLLDSMRYSLLAGGKRIRAVLCLKFCEVVGGSLEDALAAACAIEMLHTYSLIHDDLPCMDNDDMRRGKPSNHVKYGEFTAMLAGDALQALAFETLLNSDLPPKTVVCMTQILSQAAGPYGICGGQYLDLRGEGKPLAIDELLEIHEMKTAALITASALMGVLAGNGSVEQIDAASQYAQAIGIAFQVRDDVLDCTATEKELGKPIGSDRVNNKTTFATLLGIESCEEMIDRETQRAISALEGKFEDAGFLIWFAGLLAERKY